MLALVMTILSSTSSLADVVKDCIVPAVVQVESSGNHNAVGPDGDSFGLMQLQLATAQDFGYRGNEIGLLNPIKNIHYGTLYVRYLLKRYQGKVYVALDAYNRGMLNVENHPYRGDWELHRYVGKIIQHLRIICPDWESQYVEQR